MVEIPRRAATIYAPASRYPELQEALRQVALEMEQSEMWASLFVEVSQLHRDLKRALELFDDLDDTT